jgi:hypothetical protein
MSISPKGVNVIVISGAAEFGPARNISQSATIPPALPRVDPGSARACVVVQIDDIVQHGSNLESNLDGITTSRHAATGSVAEKSTPGRRARDRER